MPSFFPTLVLLAGIFFSGCERPALDPKNPVVVVEAAPVTLNPVFTSDAVGQKMGALIHAALLRLDEHNQLQPELCQKWAHQNYTRFEFTLRPGLQFQDGSSLTASDVVESILRFTDPKKNSPHYLVFKSIKEVKAIGTNVVVLETENPQPYLPYDLPLLKVFKQTPDGKIIGAGRFLLESIDAKQAVLKRFSAFQEPHPGSIESLTFKFITDDTTRYQVLVSGNANLMINALGFTKTDHLKKNFTGQLFIKDSPGTAYSYLLFSFRNPILNNLNLRKAIAHAINIKAIVQYKLNGYVEPAASLLYPSFPEYEKNITTYAYDPAKAVALLETAGIKIDPKTGYRVNLRYKCSTEKIALDTARMIQSDLRAVGINVVLEPVELGTYFSDIKNGNFDLSASRWVGIQNASIYFRAFHSNEIVNGLNRGAYKNMELDALIDKARVEVKDNRRLGLVSKIQKHVAENLPYVSLWHWSNTFIGPKNTKNLVMFPNGSYMSFPYLNLE